MKSILRITILLGALIAALPGQSAAAEGRPLVVVGWVEHITLGVEGVPINAKIDTGATTSSLHATNLRWSKRDSGEWLAFDVAGEDGKTTRFERKLVRIISIKQHGGGPPEQRPTVIIGVCVGNIYRLTEVSLADRTGFDYRFLVGRSFLSGFFAADSARIYTVEPRCGQAVRQ